MRFHVFLDRSIVYLATAVTVVTVVACSSSDDAATGEPDGGASSAPDSSDSRDASAAPESSDSSDSSAHRPAGGCGPYISALCERLQACAPYVIASGYGDVATCKARLTLTCEREIAAPGAGLDGVACAAVLPSTSKSDCASGLTCVSSGKVGTCAKKLAEGASCAGGSVCGGVLQCVSGLCADRLAAGSTCTTSGASFFGGCAFLQGLQCVSGKCTAISLG